MNKYKNIKTYDIMYVIELKNNIKNIKIDINKNFLYLMPNLTVFIIILSIIIHTLSIILQKTEENCSFLYKFLNNESIKINNGKTKKKL